MDVARDPRGPPSIENLSSNEEKERAVRLQFAESASEELNLNGEERRKLLKHASKGVVQMWAAIKETEDERKREMEVGRQRAKAGVQNLMKAREVERGAIALEEEVDADRESKEDGKAAIVGKAKGSVAKTAKSLEGVAKKGDREEVRIGKERAKQQIRELIEAGDEEREREAAVRQQESRPVEREEIVGKQKGEVVKTAKSLEAKKTPSTHHASPPGGKDRGAEGKGEGCAEEARLAVGRESAATSDSVMETPNLVDLADEDGKAELGRLLKARDEAINDLHNELKLMDAAENRGERGRSLVAGEGGTVKRPDSEDRVEVGGWGTAEELERKIKQALLEADYAAMQAAKLRKMQGSRGGFVAEGDESEEEMTFEHAIESISVGFKWLTTKLSPAQRKKKGRKGDGQHTWPIDRTARDT